MDEVTIVGGGFSATIASLFLDNTFNVITPKRSSKLKFSRLSRQSSLETNKLFSKHAQSFSMLHFNLNHGRLNDRVTLGGNSNIWGGFINATKLPKVFFNKLNTLGVVTRPLSFFVTGSQSNLSSMAQIQNRVGSIFNASNFLLNYTDGYLYSFDVEDNKIRLNVINAGKINVLYTKKLIIAVGTIQLLDLLYRSNYLKDNSLIQLSEFGHKLKLHLNLSPQKFSHNATVIRFTFIRAIFHYLGIQRAYGICKWLRWIPLYVDQIFTRQKIKISLTVRNGVISEHAFNEKIKYGGSIHYCNMQINGRSISDFLSEISPQITGLGMPFVNQAEPGPISNDIVLDTLNKVWQINNEK